MLDFRDHEGVDGLRDLTIRQVGDDVRIGDGAGGVLVLDGIERGDLGSGDFLFA